MRPTSSPRLTWLINQAKSSPRLGRAGPGHPRLCCLALDQGVDTRVEGGHDDVMCLVAWVERSKTHGDDPQRRWVSLRSTHPTLAAAIGGHRGLLSAAGDALEFTCARAELRLLQCNHVITPKLEEAASTRIGAIWSPCMDIDEFALGLYRIWPPIISCLDRTHAPRLGFGISIHNFLGWRVDYGFLAKCRT
jgi:hypothetical protein